MASDGFNDCTLDDLAEFRNGKALSTDRYSPFGKHPVFGSNGQIARSDDVLHPNSVIVIGRVGAYCGSVHRVVEPSWVTDNAIVATAKENVDLRFLYYRLNSLDLRRTAIGSAQPLMTQGGIKIIPTTAPPLAEQRAIANILGVLDDKIELNRRMNETLEGLARAIFQSWFVDFDPVRAQRDGLPLPALSPTTAALFPDSFEETSTGPLPTGWKRVPLDELTAVDSPITYGVVKPGPEDENGVRFVRGGDVKDGRIGIENLRTITNEVSEEYRRTLLQGDEILVSLVGNPGEVAIVPACLRGANIARQVGLVRLRTGISPAFVKCFLMSSVGRESLYAHSLGSVQQVINLRDLKTVRITNPGDALLCEFGRVADSLNARVEKNERQTETLAAIRDALLPKLLSGELRVAEAERLVEDAG